MAVCHSGQHAFLIPVRWLFKAYAGTKPVVRVRGLPAQAIVHVNGPRSAARLEGPSLYYAIWKSLVGLAYTTCMRDSVRPFITCSGLCISENVGYRAIFLATAGRTTAASGFRAVHCRAMLVTCRFASRTQVFACGLVDRARACRVDGRAIMIDVGSLQGHARGFCIVARRIALKLFSDVSHWTPCLQGGLPT